MPGSTIESTLKNKMTLIPKSERQQLKLVRQLEGNNVQGNLSLLRSKPKTCNGRGETPLHIAAIKGDEKLVMKLLENGADPNSPDFAGWTPLHEACNHGWYNVALALIEAGASVNVQGFDDITPLHDAAINGHSKVVNLLIEKGADIEFPNKVGKTPLDVASPRVISELSDTFTTFDKSSRVKFKLNQIKKRTEEKFQFSTDMEEKNGKDDVYEFKSSKEATPVRGNSTSPEIDKNSSDNKSDKVGDAYLVAEAESPSGKRVLPEGGENDENDDDIKKKKRKEGDGKESGNSLKVLGSNSRTNNVRTISGNSDKGGKVGNHLVNKNSSITSKASVPNAGVNLIPDRKSPGSPKSSSLTSNSSTPPYNSGKIELEQEEKSIDGDKVDQGPKVPPLKIVIPQQNANEPEQGNRNGKNNTLRHHQALPYVVSSNNNDSEKEGMRSRSASPTDPFKTDEKKDPAIGMLSAEDQKGSLHHQRVLRSAHRSGPVGNGEPRAPDSCQTRNNPGNGPNASSNTGTIAATNSSTCINLSSGGTVSAVDNPSPQSQNRSPSLPSTDSNPSNSAMVIPGSSENPSTSQVPSNYKSNSSVSGKPNSNLSNTGSVVNSDEKIIENNLEPNQGALQTSSNSSTSVELHPRKRKLKHNKEVKEPSLPQVNSERCETAATATGVHPHEQPVKNCYQLFLDIRKQIERRRKGLFPVQPKPPQGFKDYLMNRCTYVLAGNASTRQISGASLPQNLSSPMKDLFTEQEKERHRLRLQHVIEKEKLVLSVEQEILRVHGRAARALANQSLPFSVCTILKDEEVYNFITPEQEEKDRNARSRYNGRLFLSWLQDVDDKWEKIKEAMLLRHHNEAESLHAVQKMDWEWKIKELGLCEFKSKPVILESHVPMVHVSDDFDLLPA